MGRGSETALHNMGDILKRQTAQSLGASPESKEWVGQLAKYWTLIEASIYGGLEFSDRKIWNDGYATLLTHGPKIETLNIVSNWD